MTGKINVNAEVTDAGVGFYRNINTRNRNVHRVKQLRAVYLESYLPYSPSVWKLKLYLCIVSIPQSPYMETQV